MKGVFMTRLPMAGMLLLLAGTTARADEFFVDCGLEDVTGRPRLERAANVICFAVHREHHHREVRVELVQALDAGKPPDPRHLEVHQDEIRLDALE